MLAEDLKDLILGKFYRINVNLIDWFVPDGGVTFYNSIENRIIITRKDLLLYVGERESKALDFEPQFLWLNQVITPCYGLCCKGPKAFILVEKNS